MATIGTINFSATERDFIRFAINTFGNGKHPAATEKSLPYFQRDYVKRCVTKAKQSPGLVEFQQVIADEVLTRLETAKNDA